MTDDDRHLADLHFSVAEESGAAQPAESGGRVSVRWHSNLGLRVACALHLHPGAGSVEDSVRRAVEVASTLGASTLVMPVREWVAACPAADEEGTEARGEDPMKEGEEEGPFERSRLPSKRVARLFRAARLALMSLAHRNVAGKLETVTFALKSSCPSEASAAAFLADPHSEDGTALAQKDAAICRKAVLLLQETFA